MFSEISYFLLFGLPLILYLGVLTFLFFILTAAVAVLNKAGIHTIPFVWHMRCAGMTLILAVIHGTLGVLAYL